MAKEISEYPPTRDGFDRWLQDNPGRPENRDEVLKAIAADDAVEKMEQEERRQNWLKQGRQYNKFSASGEGAPMEPKSAATEDETEQS